MLEDSSSLSVEEYLSSGNLFMLIEGILRFSDILINLISIRHL